MADNTIGSQITRIEAAKKDIQTAVASYGLTDVEGVSLSDTANYVYEIGKMYIPIEGDVEGISGTKVFTGKLKVTNAPEEDNDIVRKLELDTKQEVVTPGYNIMYGITFVGTNDQYAAANAAGVIPVGSIVVITDGMADTGTSTTAKLGTAVLGTMVLGQS